MIQRPPIIKCLCNHGNRLLKLNFIFLKQWFNSFLKDMECNRSLKKLRRHDILLAQPGLSWRPHGGRSVGYGIHSYLPGSRTARVGHATLPAGCVRRAAWDDDDSWSHSWRLPVHVRFPRGDRGWMAGTRESQSDHSIDKSGNIWMEAVPSVFWSGS